jgi:hypothetical protein
VKRLVHRVGPNGEIHESPILTTYRRSRTQVNFEGLDEESPSSLSSFYFSMLVDLFPLLAQLEPQPVTTPLSVANERVRKTPPSTTSEETTVIIKRPKTETAGSRGRTRISDFDNLTKSLVDETISIFQAQIVAVKPWPSTAENWEYVSQAWIEVCSSRNVRIELDDEIFKVVSNSLLFSIIFLSY